MREMREMRMREIVREEREIVEIVGKAISVVHDSS